MYSVLYGQYDQGIPLTIVFTESPVTVTQTC